MAQIKAVPDAVADPKAGKERRVSEASAPYMNLAQSIEVARIIHNEGGSLDRTQLAAKLNYSGTKNGTFLTRVSAAKIFGLVDQPPQSDIVRTTQRGIAIVAPISETDAQRAKLDAFMSVDLYQKVYAEYKGRELPADVGLANLFLNTYKLVPNRAAPAVKVMMESAEQAGLFRMTGTASRKMISPVVGGSTVLDHQPTAKVQPQDFGSVKTGGGSGGGPTDIDDAFLALLRRLPATGTPMGKAKRQSLISAFTATVNWLFPDPDADADGS